MKNFGRVIVGLMLLLGGFSMGLYVLELPNYRFEDVWIAFAVTFFIFAAGLAFLGGVGSRRFFISAFAFALVGDVMLYGLTKSPAGAPGAEIAILIPWVFSAAQVFAALLFELRHVRGAGPGQITPQSREGVSTAVVPAHASTRSGLVLGSIALLLSLVSFGMRFNSATLARSAVQNEKIISSQVGSTYGTSDARYEDPEYLALKKQSDQYYYASLQYKHVSRLWAISGGSFLVGGLLLFWMRSRGARNFLLAALLSQGLVAVTVGALVGGYVEYFVVMGYAIAVAFFCIALAWEFSVRQSR